jgi:predicted phosphodiesterase
MRVLVLSDIHANLAALEAVIEDAAAIGYDKVWCLGDTVGYGPEPDACVARLRGLDATVVVGNHDWAAIGRMDVDEFNPEAGRAVVWTQAHLSAFSLAWLKELPDQPQVEGDFTLTHGSPRDPVWEYILRPADAAENFQWFDTSFCLVGHTHVPVLYISHAAEGRIQRQIPTFGKAMSLKAETRAILNPGSVGQPRDNDPRSAYAILDTERMTWLARRVAYPIEVTQAHMRAAGLPERLINRLAFGW